ncbi:hypothetical protein THASP1DRAFT_30530 [Thamnocephalis sphaerospora]|uniref:Uncharacterized protein n=1 Tax=Thamnocephalis sphaerospora TaxID=78915 RepID=A0A4P9XNT7_9FUNG|nr:hypothetical protein THASP1DRAFT_30530 [Thamnocephalis sphaerospora]|eukprot:RKP07653.1 hypothetical protein THASP1DRAFT_30530 [Thamnocephalis sphaerospora]
MDFGDSNGIDVGNCSLISLDNATKATATATTALSPAPPATTTTVSTAVNTASKPAIATSDTSVESLDGAKQSGKVSTVPTCTDTTNASAVTPQPASRTVDPTQVPLPASADTSLAMSSVGELIGDQAFPSSLSSLGIPDLSREISLSAPLLGDMDAADMPLPLSPIMASPLADKVADILGADAADVASERAVLEEQRLASPPSPTLALLTPSEPASAVPPTPALAASPSSVTLAPFNVPTTPPAASPTPPATAPTPLADATKADLPSPSPSERVVADDASTPPAVAFPVAVTAASDKTESPKTSMPDTTSSSPHTPVTTPIRTPKSTNAGAGSGRSQCWTPYDEENTVVFFGTPSAKELALASRVVAQLDDGTPYIPRTRLQGTPSVTTQPPSPSVHVDAAKVASKTLVPSSLSVYTTPLVEGRTGNDALATAAADAPPSSIRRTPRMTRSAIPVRLLGRSPIKDAQSPRRFSAVKSKLAACFTGDDPEKKGNVSSDSPSSATAAVSARRSAGQREDVDTAHADSATRENKPSKPMPSTASSACFSANDASVHAAAEKQLEMKPSLQPAAASCLENVTDVKGKVAADAEKKLPCVTPRSSARRTALPAVMSASKIPRLRTIVGNTGTVRRAPAVGAVAKGIAKRRTGLNTGIRPPSLRQFATAVRSSATAVRKSDKGAASTAASTAASAAMVTKGARTPRATPIRSSAAASALRSSASATVTAAAAVARRGGKHATPSAAGKGDKDAPPAAAAADGPGTPHVLIESPAVTALRQADGKRMSEPVGQRISNARHSSADSFSGAGARSTRSSSAHAAAIRSSVGGGVFIGGSRAQRSNALHDRTVVEFSVGNQHSSDIFAPQRNSTIVEASTTDSRMAAAQEDGGASTADVTEHKETAHTSSPKRKAGTEPAASAAQPAAKVACSSVAAGATAKAAATAAASRLPAPRLRRTGIPALRRNGPASLRKR